MEEKLAKFFAGEASEEEQNEVLEWRNSSEEHSNEFFEYKAAWADTIQIKPKKSPLELIGETESDAPDQKTVNISGSFSWLKYAAVVALLIIGGLYVFSNWEDWTTRPTGLTSEVKLEDGTKITLYKDAKLSEVSFSDKERMVRITGKGYFDVKRDESRPFVIYTNEAKVEVLGTSFVVDAKNNYTTEVIVENGLVAFSANPDFNNMLKTSVQLTEGEKGIITPQAKGIIKQNNRDVNYLAWQNQMLSFKQKKLSEVSKTLEEVYGYSISFENPEIRKCSLSAKFNRKTPKEIAQLIAKTFGFDVTVSGDKKIIFSGDSCY